MHSSVRTVLFLLFILSGFAGLIYESIWTHYLKLFLGHAAYAQSLVLAIFMGGMAIGSWFASRYSDRWPNLLRGYALVEGAIGVGALLFHEIFVAATEFAHASALPQLGAGPAAMALKWSLSAAMILPQSVLLGTTFPLMTAGVLRVFPDRPGRSVAMLYFTNSIGAAVGVLVSGFFLVRVTGLPGAVRIAGLVNLAVAVAVWQLARARDPAPTRSSAGHGSVRPPDRLYAVFLGVSLVTGSSSLVYEIAWIRMLSLVLGASTHAFELMLSTFILGLALGGLWVQRGIDRVASPVRFLGYVQVAMGVMALATLPVYANTFEVMQWLVRGLPRNDAGYGLFNLASGALTMAVMLPATFCAGMTLPLITYRLLRLGYGERSIGAVYALNTVGAIIGVLAAVHLGMPLLGLKGLAVFGAALDIGLGILLLSTRGANFSTWRTPVVVSAAGATAVAMTLLLVHLDPYKMASGVYRHGRLLSRDDNRVDFHRDGKTATVSVVTDGTGMRAISTNGKVDADVQMAPGWPPSQDESTMILLGALPMALHPGARTAACIGMGAGLTANILLSNPDLISVDVVEIEREMVEAAEHFRPNNDLVYNDPRSRIFIDDAKTFFSSHNRTYDLIVSEPSNPWVSGVAGLFSEEFYRLMTRYMSRDGLFVQWIQLYEIDIDLVMSVLTALDSVFSDYVIYAPNDVDAIIVARKDGFLAAPDFGRLRSPAITAALARVYIASEQDLEIRRLGTKRTWSRFIRSFQVRPNSDYYPVLDQNAARARFLRLSAGSLLSFGRAPLPALDLLTGSVPGWVDTSVTPAPFFAASRRSQMATAIMRLILGDGTIAHPTAIRANLREDAEYVKTWFRDCASLRGKPGPVPRLVFLSPHILPFLTPRELQVLWASLESGPCSAALSTEDRAWLDLLKSVGARDGGRMAETAQALLGLVPNLPPDGISYLVSVAMLGSISQGDRAGALALWSRYEKMLGARNDLLLRLLVAESQAD